MVKLTPRSAGTVTPSRAYSRVTPSATSAAPVATAPRCSAIRQFHARLDLVGAAHDELVAVGDAAEHLHAVLPGDADADRLLDRLAAPHQPDHVLAADVEHRRGGHRHRVLDRADLQMGDRVHARAGC